MGFRSLVLQKRSSEVWQLLGAIKNRVRRYGTVVNALAKQLTTASNSVESLGRRTRAISRKLRDVELLPEDQAGPHEAELLAEKVPSEIIVRNSRSARANI